ncbi:cytochrome P450 [Mycena crocata]|nr:cytochrome P450 [Mycena crocata]
MAVRAYLVASLVSLFLLFSARLLNKWKGLSRLPFPPGPEPGFLTGNLRDIPTELPWLTYTEWGKRYGEIVHARIFGAHIVVVNSAKTAVELFDRRARIYSDRPTIPMVELMEWDFNLSLMPHGEKWRQYRRMFHQHFRRDAVTAYRSIQMRKFHDLLRGLLLTPEDFFAHTKTVAAAIVMATVYEYDMKPTHDRFVDLSEEAVKRLCASVFPGVFAVNSVPFLRHLPSWFPGCGFHRFGQARLLAEMKDEPFRFVRQKMRHGVGGFSVLRKLLENNDAQGGSEAQEKVIKEVTALAYAGAADTVERKAQSEIDSVTGFSRLPIFEDRQSLPYVEAIFREVMRWRPVAPLGVAHATSEDDIYKGFFIPKGTTVLSNIWAMVHDESIYPEPDKFKPERFFDGHGQLTTEDSILAFGFGRRACVGRHVADATVWGAIVSLLSVFNIAKAKDAAGNEIPIDPVYSDGLISHPLPFQCSFTPRSEVARRLIEDTILDL